jgi:hypothetical protein
MKTRTIIGLAFFLFVAGFASQAQVQFTRERLIKAMKDELNRNMDRLALENLKKPFYISYSVRDARIMNVSASLGALISSIDRPSREHDMRVMVGDYKQNDENFLELGGDERNTMLENAGQLPLENDYQGMRRALWIATDNLYKRAAESFERKIAALQQQKLTPEEAELDDFSKAPKATLTLPARSFDIQKEKWEGAARELSALFRNYPDIQSSNVNIWLYQADAYFTNSEGTETIVPLTLATIRVSASTQATDGEPLKDALSWVALLPEDLPATASMTKDITEMAGNLVALRDAPVMDDSYTGPVLFENQAVGEAISQRLFSSSSGLIAERKPVFADKNISMYFNQSKKSTFEDKIETRIFPKEISFSAVPSMTKSGSQKLVGSFEVDGEGIKPPKSLLLVDKGTLKTLLHDRVPTPKVRESNGHRRLIIGSTEAGSATGPGVIVMNSSAGRPASELKKDLLKRAKEEGLSYAMLVRKITSPGGGADDFDISSLFMMRSGGQDDPGSKISKPVLIYKVNVADGKETLVRSAEIGGIGAGALRKIASTAKEELVYNTLLPMSGGSGLASMFSISLGGGSSGIPASFVLPKSILFEELEVKKEKRDYTPKLPAVPSPLVKQ